MNMLQLILKEKKKEMKTKLNTVKPKKKKRIIQRVLVIVNRNGLVDEAKLFTNVKRAEESFTIEALNLGARKNDIESHLDDGYFQNKNTSVCIVWPETK